MNFSVVFSLFLFVTHVIGQSCSGTQYLTTVSGSITSNYGGEYASNAYCVWELLPPNSSYTYVEISFTSFDTWPDSDYVYVYNGPSSSSQKILQWSGWNLPDPSSLFSTQASMTIVFTSDGDVIQGTGFTALYQWKTGTPPPCTGTIEVTSGDSVLNVQYPSLPQSFECTYLIKSGWTSLDYDYTASATLNSFSDSANSLEVSVYAITEGESIEWYDYPLATWNVWSLWGSSVADDSFWGELPTLQIKVVGKAASTQSTSFSISYSFTRDNYLYGDGAVGIILGSIFGSLCCMAVCVVTVLAIQRQRSGSASSGFVFTSIFRKSGYSSVGSTPQGPSTVVVQTTTAASPSYHQPQYALPPMNPEFIASQQNTNPYPYYGSNA